MLGGHALFYLASGPLNAEEIAITLGVARSNTGTSLRELEGWGLIRPVYVRGDRRQHYEAVQDVWAMFRLVLEEHKRREIDPTISVLRECLVEAQGAQPPDLHLVQRLQDALEFFRVITALYDEFRRLSDSPIRQVMKLRRKSGKLAGES